VLRKALDHALGLCRAELGRKMQAQEAPRGTFSSYFGSVLATSIDRAGTGRNQPRPPLRQGTRGGGHDDWLNSHAGRTMRERLGSDEAAIEWRNAIAQDGEGGSHVH
jgi:hypothetical protein